MSLYGAFDKTKHFSELDDPLFVQSSEGATAGVLTPAERRAKVWLNLLGSETNSEIDLGEADSSLSNVDYLDFTFEMGTAGQTGGRAKFNTNITAALGSWSNALKAQVQYGTGGSTSGLGSALVAEAIMGPASDEGNFGVLELEFGAPDGSVNPALSSFIHMVAYGDTEELAALDDDLALFSLQGVTPAASGNMVTTFSQITNAAVQASIRIRIGANTWYIPIMDTANGT